MAIPALTYIIDRLTRTPDSVPEDIVRYFVYWKVFYLMAFIGHAYTLVVFYQHGVHFMTIFNIVSVMIFVAAQILLHRGYYRTAYWGAVSELTLHGVAALVCVGPMVGFQNFPFLVLILLFIQPFYSWRFSMFSSAIVLACGVVSTRYSLMNPPIYTMAPEVVIVQTVRSAAFWPLYVLAMVLPFVIYSARAEKALAAAYDESENLLLNILPASIARRLKDSDEVIADEHSDVAVLFLDVVGFTAMSQRLNAAEIVSLLNQVIFAIDDLVERHGLEKIKTIGDAYMVAAGVPDAISDPRARLMTLALDIQSTVSGFRVPDTGEPLQVRIGLNSGSVVAGVIGHRKFVYDIWGDTVNLASRMESTGSPGRIHLPEQMAQGLADRFAFEARGPVEVKGKGPIDTCFLLGPGPSGPGKVSA